MYIIKILGGDFMKREYSKPSMNIEVFQANEYIAACGKPDCEDTKIDRERTYNVYLDNGDNKFNSSKDKFITNVPGSNICRLDDDDHNNMKLEKGFLMDTQKGKIIGVYYNISNGTLHAAKWDEVEWETNSPNASN